MRINGKNRLACKTLIKDVNPDKPITVEPIKGLPVEKDLIVDMEPFFDAYREVMPFLVTTGNEPTRERIQSQEDRERFDDTTKCILCAACTTCCPVFWNDGQYFGPAGDRRRAPLHLRQPRRGRRAAARDPQRQGGRVALPHHLQLHRGLPARHPGHPGDPGGQARTADEQVLARVRRPLRAAAASLVLAVGGAVVSPALVPAAATPRPTPKATPRTPTLPVPKATVDPRLSVGGERLASMGIVADLPAGVPAPPRLKDVSWVLADLDSGEIIAAKAAHARLLPASTLKTLTALTLIPRVDADRAYAATTEDANADGTRVGILPGHTYTGRQLFRPCSCRRATTRPTRWRVPAAAWSRPWRR